MAHPEVSAIHSILDARAHRHSRLVHVTVIDEGERERERECPAHLDITAGFALGRGPNPSAIAPGTVPAQPNSDHLLQVVRVRDRRALPGPHDGFHITNFSFEPCSVSTKLPV